MPVLQRVGTWVIPSSLGGARGIDLGSPADDVLVPRVAGDWQNIVLYSLPGASVPLVVGQSYSTQGASDNVHQEVVPCFVKGTMIKTACGEVPIERLVKGDLVFTQDAGYQPVVWVGTKTVPVNENTAPIRFEVGSVGNDRPLMVSPNHRMLVRSLHAELLFGSSEVLNLFPELAQDDTFKAMTARTCLKSYETSALMETFH
ncbi:Hint domain-containing protein [Ascidiaceihabitans sp.]|uniref:Hint domain-containing protein n=1 Tax=Ascidiaceihabitans sp. TaxID=1872644 RepID=UPI00329928B5